MRKCINRHSTTTAFVRARVVRACGREKTRRIELERGERGSDDANRNESNRNDDDDDDDGDDDDADVVDVGENPLQLCTRK